MKHTVNELGRTMLEMLGVLAIMGVIMYGAIAGIGFGVEMYQINAAYHQIEEISEGAFELYSWRRWYSPDMTTEICRNDITDCDSTTNAITASLGGARVEVRGANCNNAGQCFKFQIRYSQISFLACTKLLDNDGTRYKYVACVANGNAGCQSNHANVVECTSE
ncbi:MAG: hypothetical protein II942_05250 [Alphaproteobacteria bacterium]|nr:hypothetical protein [Alphaproteobacteria bacterium]